MERVSRSQQDPKYYEKLDRVLRKALNGQLRPFVRFASANGLTVGKQDIGTPRGRDTVLGVVHRLVVTRPSFSDAEQAKSDEWLKSRGVIGWEPLGRFTG